MVRSEVVKVKALQKGFDGRRIVMPGTVFEVSAGSQGAWFAPVAKKLTVSVKPVGTKSVDARSEKAAGRLSGTGAGKKAGGKS